jgi:hypothetical protein
MKTRSSEQNVLLILCDISGYTRFMTANQHARMHACAVITELIRAVMKNAQKPMRVSKLEGDAVFLYLPVANGNDLKRQSESIRQRLNRIFAAFELRLAELEQSNICPCEACTNVSQLKLKIIVHYGLAMQHAIGPFTELSGVDVILVHRLLKNAVERDRYLLLTEAAQAILMETDLEGAAGEETYDDLGTFKTFVYEPPFGNTAAPAPVEPRRYATRYHQVRNDLLKIYHSRLMALGLKRPPQLNHLLQARTEDDMRAFQPREAR